MKFWVLSVAHLIFIAFPAQGSEVPKSLVEGLSSENFKTRETSQAELLAWVEQGGNDEIASIYGLSQNSEDPEVSQRCLKVLRKLSDQDYLSDGQGYLGIQMREEMTDLPDDDEPRFCIRVSRVVGDSPASLAGLRPGDLITALDGKKWYKAGAIDEFIQKIADSKPLKTVVITIKRKDENPLEVTVRLGKRPVKNLRGIGQDLKLLDQRAREMHFEKWLESQAVKE